MKKQKKHSLIFRLIGSYIIFFLISAFIISCHLMLFLNLFANKIQFEFTQENIRDAAILTFANVLFITLVFTVFELIRRTFTIDRPVKKITQAAEQIIHGDFSVKIKTPKRFLTDSAFTPVITSFNQIASELGSVEALRADFISNVSHEMKTPLAVMHNYASLLQTPGLSDEKRIEYAKCIEETTKHTADMVSNILKLNRLENQQIYPKTREFDLGEQICECLLQYESVWEKSDIKINTDIEQDITIKADEELLALVWNNLFSNAFKFTPAGGTVSVSLTSSEHHAIVRVSDTGCGMSPEVGEHIFEKFYQGDTSHSTQGNGLGLALVKRVIDIMQGEIRVESAINQGSTFTVRIRRK